MSQPIDLTVDVAVEASTVGDLRTLVRFLTDLGIPEATSLHDEVTISLALPVTDWQAEHPCTLKVEVGHP